VSLHHTSSETKSTNTTHSNLGGVIMFVTGVLYLLFEKSILAQSGTAEGELAQSTADPVTRSIFGTQVRHPFQFQMHNC